MATKADVPTCQRCVACGKFMRCEDPDASCDFTPDSHFGPERVEWTCGPCRRTARAEPGAAGSTG